MEYLTPLINDSLLNFQKLNNKLDKLDCLPDAEWEDFSEDVKLQLTNYQEQFQSFLLLLKKMITYGCSIESELDDLKLKNEELLIKVETLEQQPLKDDKENGEIDCPSETCAWEGVTDITKEVQKIASEVGESKFVYDETSKMYYDTSSGYYYNPETKLFYDHNSRIYFYYDESDNTYKFYSQVESEDDSTNQFSCEQPSDLEPGEIPDDSLCEVSSPSYLPNYEPYHQITAPSLRLIVTEGEMAGQLFVVTIDGSSIGSDKSHSICLACQSVSKNHAEISYEKDDLNGHHFYIHDVGSRNGTYVKGKRLSIAKQTSEKVEIGHGWKIQCGFVRMDCHVHPGLNTCNECEPGLLVAKSNSNNQEYQREPSEDKEKARKRQMRKIRKKVGLSVDKPEKSSAAYSDRAAERRQTVGSDNPYEKTQVADVNEMIPCNNIGMKMMQKMGWKEGDSLGMSNDGIKEPIIPETSFSMNSLEPRTKISVKLKSYSNLKSKPIAFLPSSDCDNSEEPKDMPKES